MVLLPINSFSIKLTGDAREEIERVIFEFYKAISEFQPLIDVTALFGNVS